MKEKRQGVPGPDKSCTPRKAAGNPRQGSVSSGEWKRATFFVRKDNLKKIKAVAYWDRKKIKEVMDEAMLLYLEDKNPDVYR